MPIRGQFDDLDTVTTRVLYILGTGRSGSTFLANVLGQVKGVFSAGELRYIWERGFVQDRLCGCGSAFSECEVWTAIVDEAFGGRSGVDPHEMMRAQERTARLRRVADLISVRRSAAMYDGESEYLETLCALYGAIRRVTGADVVVDSSKLPAYAGALAEVDDLDLSLLHLIRDPRAAAYSWSRRKELADRSSQTHMEQIGPLKSSVLWDVWNAAAEIKWGRNGTRYLRMRYEDIVSEPRQQVETVLAAAGLGDAEIPFLGDRAVEIAPTHIVAGNPDRLRRGSVAIRRDDEWERSMRRSDRLVVTATTWPLLRHYGYSSASPDVLPQDAPPMRRLVARAGRHWTWGRQQGFGRLVEEDNLNPMDRLRGGVERWRWRRTHDIEPGTARPVWLLGVQRSGTNMIVRGLERAPEFEVRNENDKAAFSRFRLAEDAQIMRLIEHARHPYVLFKPLCDLHRAPDLLGLPTRSHGRALWAFRDVDSRARSAVAKFRDVNRRALSRVAEGAGADTWQAQGMTQGTLDEIRSFDWDQLDDHSAAAMFWYVRNKLYFDLGLDGRADTLLVSYDDFVADAESAMRVICSFLELEFRPALIAHVEDRSPGPELRIDLDPGVRELCTGLYERLVTAAERSRARFT